MFTLFNKSELEPSKSDPKNQKKNWKIDDFFYHPSNPYSRSPQEWPSHSSKHHSWVWGRPHERPLKSGKSTSYHGPTLMQQVPVLRGSQMPARTDVWLQPFPWRAKLKLRRIKSGTSFQNWLKLLIVCFWSHFDRRQNQVQKFCVSLLRITQQVLGSVSDCWRKVETTQSRVQTVLPSKK